MKVVLHVDFYTKKNEGCQGYARLELDLPFAPTMDLVFEQTAWKRGRKPVSISYCVDDREFYVVLERDVLDSSEQTPQHKEMYKGHGWTLSKS